MTSIIREYWTRIVSALHFRSRRIFQPPPGPEIDFIGMTGNHGLFREKLRQLDQAEAAEAVGRHSVYVGLCWFRLALEHLEDANHSFNGGRNRSTHSRSYYAAYNASKAVRYIVDGAVSLKGDDHHKASDLPDDFPDVDRWSEEVTKLYELACTRFRRHRVRCFHGTGGASWRGGSLHESSSLRRCA
jgi:HEPN domain-containing protein